MKKRGPIDLGDVFILSAGAALLASATALFLTSLTGAKFIHPHDPIFRIPILWLFRIIGGMELVAGLICLFSHRQILRLVLILWLAANLAGYYLALPVVGVTAGLKGYLGDFTDTFGIARSTINTMLIGKILYLSLGSAVCLVGNRVLERRRRENPSLKMTCAQCGGHIEFFLRNLGQKIPCPHCQTAITLRKPDNLKMPCYFCKGNIEFPAHAIGQKLKCPHCNMHIGLKEPA